MATTTEIPTAVVPASTTLAAALRHRLPPVPWRDPHTVSPAELSQFIRDLEKACEENPGSVELRTSLGMAYAVNFEVYKSMDALEAAVQIEPEHFWAQFKYAELHYRLRALQRAEDETLKAVELAGNPVELAVARKQLQEIRRLRRESARDVAWTKPLTMPVLVLGAMLIFTCIAMVWK